MAGAAMRGGPGSRAASPGKLGGTVGAVLLLALIAGCTLPGRGGVSVWIVGDHRGVTAEENALPENEVYSAARGAVELSAAINETLGLQLVVRTQAPPAGPFDVRVGDLVGPGGTLPAASNVALYRVGGVRIDQFRAWFTPHTGRPATPIVVPDVLVPWDAPTGGGPLRCDTASNEIVWIDLTIPPTTEPGEYSGTIELVRRDDGKAAFSTALRVRVAPVALPSERSLPLICRIDPSELLTEYLKWPAGAPEDLRLLASSPRQAGAVRLVQATMQLFHQHRLTPALWASFPKFRPTADRGIEIDWEGYDDLVSGWLDGSAFADRVGLAAWPIPVSLNYPDAEQNGGFDSAGYARLLAAYLAACREHFDERGWLGRSFVRLLPIEPLSQASVARARRLGGIVSGVEGGLTVVTHLPGESLRGLGWYNAPPVNGADFGLLAPPASWFEPRVMQQLRALGKRNGFAPDVPPFAPPLSAAGRATDGAALSWLAFRYQTQPAWIDDAARLSPRGGPGLIYSGKDHGVGDRPLASVRMKRLRRGLQDYELLRLLDRGGQSLLARRTAEQVVRYAFTDAVTDNLLATRATGWTDEPLVLWLARTLLLQELENQFDPTPEGRQRQIGYLSSWEQLLARTPPIHVKVDPVRLSVSGDSAVATIPAVLTNDSGQVVVGGWRVESVPTGWRAREARPTLTTSHARSVTPIEFDVRALSYNADGLMPLSLEFDSEARGAFRAAGRLAVAASPLVDVSPRIDGDAGDWPRAATNSAGDFRLVRPLSDGAQRVDAPQAATRAFFAQDREHLLFLIVAQLRPGQPPQWQTDNTVPIDGAIPWGQDVVEILLNPSNSPDAAPGDLYVLQVKPSGLLVARKGARTDPPLGPSVDWPCGARAASRVGRDAWVVEVALPLSAFDAAALRSRVWGCNITRLDSRRGEYSSWSGAQGYCYSARALGNLIVSRP